MAAIVTEKTIIQVAQGEQGLVKLTGSAVVTDATTSFIITPGNDTTNVTNQAGVSSSSIKSFTAWGFTNNVSANGFRAVKTYDATQKGDILTVTCTALDGFDWWVEGPANS